MKRVKQWTCKVCGCKYIPYGYYGICSSCKQLQVLCACGCGQTVSKYNAKTGALQTRCVGHHYHDPDAMRSNASKRAKKQHVKTGFDSAARAARAALFWSKKENRQAHSTRMKKENNPNWQGGISFEDYPDAFSLELKLEILARDKRTCQLCSCAVQRSKYAVHHIDYNKRHNSKSNLITLCRSCHMKTNFNRKHWQALLTKKAAALEESAAAAVSSCAL